MELEKCLQVNSFVQKQGYTFGHPNQLHGFYENGRLVLSQEIDRLNGITYSYGHYEQAFDGLLQHRFGKFHIFLNLDRHTGIETPRMRFTFSHEIGHYFIDEHRNAFKSGKVKEHPSFNSLVARNPAEKEADYFASCLLMPAVKFKEFCRRKPLNSKLIEDLSKHFQCSISSVIFPYLDLSLFPMIIVMSKDGKIQWGWPINDFKYRFFRKDGTPVPVNTAAEEFFSKGKQYKTEEIVFTDDWFLDLYRIKDEQFWGKCYYLPGNKVMSVIWKKER